MDPLAPSDREPVALAYPGDALAAGAWQVSDWPAGQSGTLTWSPGHVCATEDGGLDLRLGAAPRGAPRPFLGGEVQSVDAAATGTWGWTAQAPRMASGAVFGMFTFQADWANDPWLEFDFEFVGAETARVRLNIHLGDAGGRRVSLEDVRGGPVLVDLGFDAAKGLHSYEIAVAPGRAVFRIDGRDVGRFGPEDLPGVPWRTASMKGFANLWCVDPALEPWAGPWRPPRRPLVAHLAALRLSPSWEPAAAAP